MALSGFRRSTAKATMVFDFAPAAPVIPLTPGRESYVEELIPVVTPRIARERARQDREWAEYLLSVGITATTPAAEIDPPDAPTNSHAAWKDTSQSSLAPDAWATPDAAAWVAKRIEILEGNKAAAIAGGRDVDALRIVREIQEWQRGNTPTAGVEEVVLTSNQLAQSLEDTAARQYGLGND